MFKHLKPVEYPLVCQMPALYRTRLKLDVVENPFKFRDRIQCIIKTKDNWHGERHYDIGKFMVAVTDVDKGLDITWPDVKIKRDGLIISQTVLIDNVIAGFSFHGIAVTKGTDTLHFMYHMKLRS